MAHLVKNLPAMRETWVRSLGWEDALEKGKATHSSIRPGEFQGLYSPWGHREADKSNFRFSQLICSVALASGAQQRDSVMPTHISMVSDFPLQVIMTCLVEFPVLYCRSLTLICFVYCSVCLSCPAS